MLFMQDGVPIAHIKKDRNLFILDLMAFGKVIHVSTQIMMTIRRGRPTHLVSRIKKVRIWHRKFGYVNNIRVILALKLLTGMGDSGKNYNLAKIYSNSEAFELEESLDGVNPIANDPINASTAIKTLYGIPMKASKITNTDSYFDEICELCVRDKQTWVVRRYKLMTSAEEKLKEVHVNF